jgi:uncharacterized damage-inducible protein DinB
MIVRQARWVERRFVFGLPTGVFPCILERFRGTPARLEELVRDLSPDTLLSKAGGGWSVQEHAGHLFDLEELGEKRLQEFLAREPVLSAADMNNRKTTEAGHNAKEMKTILRDFRQAREHLVRQLDRLSDSQVAFSSIHPRLNCPMTVTDWVCFMAEHDDHHLARIRSLLPGSSAE